MTLQQKKVNEDFFSRLLDLLKDNGVWMWPQANEILVKKNGKLAGNKHALKLLKEITTTSFFEKNFVSL